MKITKKLQIVLLFAQTVLQDVITIAKLMSTNPLGSELKKLAFPGTFKQIDLKALIPPAELDGKLPCFDELSEDQKNFIAKQNEIDENYKEQAYNIAKSTYNFIFDVAEITDEVEESEIADELFKMGNATNEEIHTISNPTESLNIAESSQELAEPSKNAQTSLQLTNVPKVGPVIIGLLEDEGIFTVEALSKVNAESLKEAWLDKGVVNFTISKIPEIIANAQKLLSGE
jgi:hypothetical protein